MKNIPKGNDLVVAWEIMSNELPYDLDGKDITLTISVYNPYPYNTGSPYYIHVIRNHNVVVVYGLDSSNHYSKVVQTFVVSVGKSSTPTPTGTFKTSNKYSRFFVHVFDNALL